MPEACACYCIAILRSDLRNVLATVIKEKGYWLVVICHTEKVYLLVPTVL